MVRSTTGSFDVSISMDLTGEQLALYKCTSEGNSPM